MGRYWFDILTPKQLLFFRPLIAELRAAGDVALVTSRGYREVEQLAALMHIEPTFVGRRGGKDPVDQLEASIDRMRALLPLVSNFGPDVALSVASADCARISFGLRVRHVAVNDSPHSTVAGRLALPLSSHLLSPWIIPYSDWYRFGLRRGDITRYRALDPAAWLKRESPAVPSSVGGLEPGRLTIMVRLEESYAPYMIGTSETWSGLVLQRLAETFDGFNLIALCRYQEQLEQVRERFGGVFTVPETAVDGASLIRRSDVFIGMGGTMTTEAALLGVPTISVYQGSPLYTERYLSSKRLLLKTRDLDTLVRYVRWALGEKYRAACRRRAKAVLDSMEDPIEVILRYLKSP